MTWAADSYEDFLRRKEPRPQACGFEPRDLNPALFAWQRHVVEWAVHRGRAALFEDCGLGKTLQQLEWSRQVVQHTGRPVLVLAPLAVAGQTVREGERFGIEVEYAPTPEAWRGCPIVVTNYERLPAWRGDVGRFGGIVLDESSILKSFMGRTKRDIIEAFEGTPYKLACTATPAPNDHTELGNHAEFLGVMSRTEMLSRWFINDLSQPIDPWRLKTHAVDAFWRWVTSWAVCVGKPSDVGDYSDDGYVLPVLTTPRHVVSVDVIDGRAGALFRMPAMSATGMHTERRRTAIDRARRVGELIGAERGEPWILWCDTDYEADALTAAIPGAIEVRGSMSMDVKESALKAFSGGSIDVLVSKPSICGFGLNWQHCARMAFVGATYSFEAWYQAIRRCWRFGQERPVDAHMIVATTETHVLDALDRKRRDHTRLQRAMFDAARRAQRDEAARGHYTAAKTAQLPSFMRSA